MSNEQKAQDQHQNKQPNDHKTATSGVYTNFADAPADSNVNPPGAPLNSHGSAVEPVAGGTQGAIEASRSMQQGMGGAAGGGNPGTSAGTGTVADGNPAHHPGTEASDMMANPPNADQGESRRDS